MVDWAGDTVDVLDVQRTLQRPFVAADRPIGGYLSPVFAQITVGSPQVSWRFRPIPTAGSGRRGPW
jgi:hypothetical protein